jgi:L-threonylcarbamoyladenylate synthase
MTALRSTEGDGPPRLSLDATAAEALESCLASGGVAIFPSDTVYGLAADPESDDAARRLHALKRRPPMPSAVMFFSLAPALAALPELGPNTRRAVERLLPGPLTLVLPNPERRYRLACGEDPRRLGLRVPALDGALAPLAACRRPLLQSSANLHGGADPKRLDDVPLEIRRAADIVLDGGELPGIASTVVDLSNYEDGRQFAILREAAVSKSELAARLDD